MVNAKVEHIPEKISSNREIIEEVMF